MKLERTLADRYGGIDEFDRRVRAFRQALIDHRLTVDVPAPVEDDLIRDAAAAGEIEWVAPTPPPPMPAAGVNLGPLMPGLELTDFKRQAQQRIDYLAEFHRQTELTPGAGQAMEYQYTEFEARRWKPGDSLVGYPFLRAEARAIFRATGQQVTPAELVEGILVLANAWARKGSRIKEERRFLKLKIDQASSVEEVEALLLHTWDLGDE